MRSRLAAGLVYTGVILLSFGLSVSLIKLLNARYGEPNEMFGLMGPAVLVIGIGMAAAGYFMKRQRKTTND